ncbi:MAG: protein kinase [Acidobacteria bacterium]|nr:protein kinase [Acidobacteriota bacterium]
MSELRLVNSRLDKRYEITERLGRGSYAEIFLATDTIAAPNSPHRQVVIKVLNVFLQDDVDDDLERTLVENFQNEAIALDRVRHPNIISRLGHGTARDLDGRMFHYLVLEYMPGGDLHKVCRERTLELSEAIGYLEQVSAGLRHAHAKGVIHRDIKPQNLLLSGDLKVVKIADFGVARVHATDAPITRVGTNIYAPPEHSPFFAGKEANRPASSLTPAADVYSLAKTLYTLATGEAPRFYANEPLTDLPMQVRNEPWANELKRVFRRATDEDETVRHQSVDEFWADLEPVRRLISGGETETHVRPKLHTIPQPQIALGYSPNAPTKPEFDTSRDLRLRMPLMPERRGPAPVADQPRIEEPLANGHSGRVAHPLQQGNGRFSVNLDAPAANPVGHARRRSSRLRKAVLAAVVLVFFGIGLYGTSVYLQGLGLIPAFQNPLASVPVGITNTDVNLRQGPSANTPIIGLVTRGSEVRVLKRESNNWYQVEIVKQGRERREELASGKGWLNGRFVDVE